MRNSCSGGLLAGHSTATISTDPTLGRRMIGGTGSQRIRSPFLLMFSVTPIETQPLPDGAASLQGNRRSSRSCRLLSSTVRMMMLCLGLFLCAWQLWHYRKLCFSSPSGLQISTHWLWRSVHDRFRPPRISATWRRRRRLASSPLFAEVHRGDLVMDRAQSESLYPL